MTTPKERISLSIVIPLKDEGPNLRSLCGELCTALAGLKESYEIIFVDDGSVDGSIGEIRQLIAQDAPANGYAPRSRTLRRQRHRTGLFVQAMQIGQVRPKHGARAGLCGQQTIYCVGQSHARDVWLVESTAALVDANLTCSLPFPRASLSGGVGCLPFLTKIGVI